MNFGQKQTLKAVPAVVGTHASGNVIQQVLVASGVTDLQVGQAVVITDGSVTGRWDGATVAAETTLAIVTAKQFEGDNSVSVLRAGSYIRDRIVLSDDTALTVSAEFKLSLCQLYAEGAWV